MKNKEIEKILNERKIDTYAIISKEEAKTILSYIEQLENNRDKAIEYIEIELSQGGERELRDLVDGYEVLNILKGDSE